jgi:hypothetical protein
MMSLEVVRPSKATVANLTDVLPLPVVVRSGGGWTGCFVV